MANDINDDISKKVIAEVLTEAKENEDVKDAGKRVAKSINTISKLVDNALLPIAAINYGFDKARQYFENKFQDDLSEKIKNIEPENIVEPSLSIAGPVLRVCNLNCVTARLTNSV